MNLDHRFPLFDSLLYGPLDPMKPGNELNSGYEIRVQEQIFANATETGVFNMKYMPVLNVKCTYYKRLLTGETFQYCTEWLTYLQEEEDFRIRAYLKDRLLDKHLVTCLKKLGERIRQDQLQLSQLTHPTPETDIELVTNVYIFQLLKVCLAKVFLEFQHCLSDVASNKQTEAMLYSAYIGEIEYSGVN
jgi:hypothetical protein